MSEDAKRKAIKKYFKPFPYWSILFILLGIVVFIIGTQSSGGVAVAGIVSLAIGGLAIYASAGGKPSDSQMDEYIKEDFERVNKQMLKKLGLDESELVAETQYVYGPGEYKSGVADLWKVGSDLRCRYTPIGCTAIGFGEKQLVYFNCLLDLTTGNMLDVATDEYFYKDVVSASTKSMSTSFRFKNGQTLQFDEAEVFTLTTSGGTAVTTALESRQLLQAKGVKSKEIELNSADKALQVIRRMLRDKKG